MSWDLPPDPTVFAMVGAAPFAGWSVAHGNSGWVATGTVDPGTWRSSDGVHWSAVAVDLPGLQRAQVQAVVGGFAMVAQVYDGHQSSARVLTSSDGAVWTPLDLPAGVSAPQPGGAVGLIAVRSDQVNGSPVNHVDGSTWRGSKPISPNSAGCPSRTWLSYTGACSPSPRARTRAAPARPSFPRMAPSG